MFQMLEIVGVSEVSFAEAAKSAITKITESGEKVFWFEVVEERGAVHHGKVEFQIKLKAAVAVESNDSDELYLCPSCGRASDCADNLCNPKKVK